MWQLVAAEAPIPDDSNVALILGIVGSIATVLVAAVGGIFALLTAKANRTTSSPPPPSGAATVAHLDANEVRRRLDDSDERDEMQDRRHERHERSMDRFSDRVDRIEEHLDRTSPGWRRAP